MALLFAGVARAQTVLTWSSGDILNVTTGLGATLSVPTISNLDTVNITTAGSHTFDGRTVVNNGTINWSGGSLVAGNSATLTNNATFNDTSTGVFGNSGVGGTTMTFTNAAGAIYNKQSAGTKDTNVTFNNDGAVNVSVGTLQFGSGGTNSATGTLTAGTGATIRFTGSYTLADAVKLVAVGTGLFELTNGTLSLPGALSVPTFNQTGGTLAGTNTLANGTTFNWTGGNWNAGSTTTTIASGGILNVSTASSHNFDGRAIVNNGTINWSGGNLVAGNSANLTNNATFNDTSTGVFGNSGVGGTTMTFTNAAGGTYNKQSAGTKDTNVSFTNAGTVNVDAGTLRFNGGGSSTGTIDADAGTTVQFTNNYSVPDASKLLGTGLYELTNGTLSTGGSLNAPVFNQAGGTLSGTLSLTNVFNWTGGNWNASGTTTVASSATLNLSTANSHNFDGHAIVNNGTINWSAGNFVAGNSATLTNNATLNDTSTGVFGNSGVGGTTMTFTNATGATYNKQSAGTKDTNVTFNNDGAVNVSVGTLQFGSGGTNSATGTLTAGTGATIRFTGSYTLADAAKLVAVGTGLFELTNGTLSLPGTLSVPTFNQTGGTLAGTNTLANGTTFNWTAGNWNAGSTTTTIASGGILNVSTASSHNFDGRAIVNNGTINWSAGNLVAGNSATLTNNATLNDTSTGVFGNSGVGGTTMTFTNAAGGTYNKQSAGTKDTNVTFNNDGAVNVSLGTLQFGSGGTNSATGTLTAGTGATIRFTGSYTLADAAKLVAVGTGLFELTNGTLSLPGALSVPTFNQTGGTLAGTNTLANGTTFNWTAGNWNAGSTTTTIASGGILNVSTASSHNFDGRAIVNNGTINWSGGNLVAGNSATLTNNATFNDTSTGVFGNSGVGGTTMTFTNAADGTYNASATKSVSVVFTNDGTLNVQSGTFSLSGGGTSTGTVNVPSGATLALNGQNFAFNTGSSITGAGTVNVTGATTSFAGSATNSAAFLFSGGTATFAGTTATSGNVTLSGGTIGGTGTLTTSGPFSWTSGDLTAGGILNANGGGSLSSANAKYLTNHTLNLDGTTTWSAGPIYSGNNSTITIKPGATFTTNFDGTVYYNLGGTRATIDNQSAFAKSAGTGTTDIQTIFNNASTGTVNVQTGTLNLSGGGASAGTVNVSSGATLALNGQNFDFNTGSVINGAGTVNVTGATTSFAGSATNSAAFLFSGGTATFAGTTATSGNVTLSGGTIGGTGTLTTSGPFSWTSGDLTAGGILNANGGGSLSSANAKYLTNHTLNLDGTTTWSAGPIYSGNGSTITIKPGATFTTNFDGTVYYNLGGTRATIDNQSAFAKSAGTGTTDIQAIFNNASTGTVNVQTGTLNLSGGGASAGTVNVSSGATLALNGQNFDFNTGSVINGAGTVNVSGGTTTFSGANTGSASLSLSGGTAAFNGTTSTTGGGAFSGGTFNGTGTLSFGGPLAISGGDLNGTGTLTANGGAAITNSFVLRAGQTLTLAGNSTWSAGIIYEGTGSVLNNTGTLTNTGNTPFYYNYGGTKLTFNNSGTFTKSTATGDSYLDATVNNTGTINVQSGSVSIGGGGTNSGTINVSSGATFALNNGSFAFNAGSIINGAGTVLVSGGTTTFSGANTGSASLSLSGGTATFNGTTSTTGGGAFSGGTFNGTGTLSFGGLLTWSGTTLNGTGIINANGGLSFTNSASLYGGQTLNLAGVSTWSGGTLYQGTGAILNNSGTFTATSNDSIYSYYGGSRLAFNNSGMFAKNGGTGTTSIDAVFTNTGLVKVQTGLLSFDAGGSSTGTFDVTPGATLRFNSNYAIGAGATFTSNGNVQLASGTLTLAAPLRVGQFNQIGGTLAGAGPIEGRYDWSGGNWNGAGTTTIASGAALNLSAANDNVRDFQSHTIVNQGVANWSSGYIRGGLGSSFTNAAGGVFNDYVSGTTYSVYNPWGGTFVFTNDGSYFRNSAGTTFFDTTFNNNGTLKLISGDIQIRQGGTMSATSVVQAAAGTRLYFTNNYTLLDGAQFSGAGLINQTAGTLTLDGALRANSFLWSGGNWNAAANSGLTTTIASGTILNVTAANDSYRDLYGRGIINQGIVNWSSGYLRGGQGSSFTNAAGGIFNDFISGTTYSVYNAWGGAFVFTNDGTYNRNSTGTTFFDTTFNNNGSLKLQQGDIQFRQGGSMSASGTMAAVLGTNIYFTNNYSIASGASLSGAGTYWLTGGTLSLGGTVGSTRFNQTGGALAGTNTLSGTYAWSGGTWNGSGTTTIAGGTTLNLTATNDNVRDFQSHAIVNQGVVNWSSAYLRGGAGSSFTNAAGGVFNDFNSGGYTVHNPGWGGSFVFANDGTYLRNAGGTTYFDTTFNNTGTVRLLSGDIQLRQGGTMSATSIVQAIPGTHLYFTNNYTLLDGALFIGSGLFSQTGGTLTLNGSLRASAFLWSGGNWSAAANSGLTTTIASGTVLNLSAANDNTRDFYGRSIVNQGVVNWSSAYLRGGQGSAFTNAAGGIFNDYNSGNYTVHNPGWGGAFVFTNDGTYVRYAGGTTSFDTTFDNNGTLKLVGGDIQIRQGGTMSATSIAQAAADSHLYITNNYTLLDGAQFIGPGLFNQTAGTLTLDGTLRASAFLWSGGNWSAAANSGLTTTIASGTVLNLTAANDNTRDFYGRNIVNQGVVNWSSAYLRGGQGSSFTNAAGAVFNDLNTGGYSIHNPGWGGTFTFTNAGSYVKSGASTTSFDVPFTNTGSLRAQAGTLSFTSTFTNTGGTLTAAGGNFSFSNPLSLGTGKIGGSGTFTSSTVTAGGVVAPGNPVGLLTIAGNLTLQPGASSQFEIGGPVRGTQYDAIDVSASATLAGSLQLGFVNGGYAGVQNGDTLTLLSAGSLTGAFGNIASGARLASTDGAGSFVVTVAGNTVTLSQFTLGANTYIWSGGDLITVGSVTPSLLSANTVPTGGRMAISTAADHDFNAQTVVNNGTIDWTGGNLRSGNGGTLTNNGVFNDTASGIVNNAFNGTALVFTNASGATYNKIAAGQTAFRTPFNNDGTLNLNAGSMSLEGGGAFSASGSATAATGTTLFFNSNYSLNGGASLGGAGTYELDSNTLTVSGTVGISNFLLAGGTLAGTHTLGGNATWTSTALNSGGTTTIGGNGTLTIASAVDHDFNSRAIVNNGTINWIAGTLRSGNSGTFTNNSVFNDTASNVVNNAYNGTALTFANAVGATYNKAATGTTSFQVPFNNSGTVNVQAGTLQLAGGGTLAGSGVINTAVGASIDFSNDYTLASGSSLTGPGSFVLSAGTLTGTGNVNVSNLFISGGMLAGAQTFAGSLTWNGGTLNNGGTTTIGNTGALTIAGSIDHDFNSHVIVNNGTVNWTAGTLRSGNSGTFTNTGVFNDTASNIVNNAYNGSALIFSNAVGAMYNKAATGTTSFQVPFNNSGNVNVQAGTLQLAGGGTLASTGIIDAGTGTSVDFTNDYTLASGSSLTGPGSFVLSGGTLTGTGNVSVSNLFISGGMLAGAQTFAGSVTWNGGTLNNGGTTTIGNTGTLTIAGNIDHDFNSHVVANNGTINWIAGTLRSGNGGTFTNSGTLNDTASNVMNNAFNGTALVFTNSSTGTYNKITAGTSSFQVPFNNSGTVNVQAGTLQLAGGGTLAGAGIINTAAGTSVDFSNDYSLANGSWLTGPGSFVLSGGTLTGTGNVSVSNLFISGGMLAGAQTFAGSLTWNGGNLNNGGTTTIGSTGALTIAGNIDHDFNSHAIVNNGTINWAAGTLRSGNGGTFTNNGTLNDTASSVVNNDYNGTALAFTNSSTGTYNKIAAGTTTIAVPFTNSGTLNISAGALVFGSSFTNNNGTVTFSGSATAQFAGTLDLGSGPLAGSGTITAPSVIARGLVSPGNSPGQLNITGDLTLVSSSLLLFELGGISQGVNYDFLSVSGAAALDGNLQLKFVNGYQSVITPGATFTVLSAASLSGVFANVLTTGLRLNTVDGFGSFQVNFGAGSPFAASSLVLSNFIAVPEPSTWALMITGGLLLILQLRRRRR